VAEDDREAVNWYRKAADLGYAKAMSNLGVKYALGEGVVQDDIEAYAWLSTAAAFGDKKASELRDLLARRLTPEARLTAQARAREHVARIQKAIKK